MTNRPLNQIDHEIKAEIYRRLELLGADPKLLGLVGAWWDTLAEDLVLQGADLREGRQHVVAAPGQHAQRVAAALEHGPEAVVLQLEDPARPVERRRGEALGTAMSR
jgi:hypothetical protein